MAVLQIHQTFYLLILVTAIFRMRPSRNSYAVWMRSHSVSSAFTCETSPSGYSDLPSGNYTFRVKAVDSNGNTGTDAKFAWNILNRTSGSSSNGPPQPVVNHGPVANGSTCQN